MAVSGQGEHGSRLCRALGLDPKKVRGLTLKVPIDDVISIEAEIMPDKKDVEALGYELRRYGLIELDGKGNPTGTLTVKKDVWYTDNI
jgi:hypothetical protein